jgi:hypothetical protein
LNFFPYTSILLTTAHDNSPSIHARFTLAPAHGFPLKKHTSLILLKVAYMKGLLVFHQGKAAWRKQRAAFPGARWGSVMRAWLAARLMRTLHVPL